jgi:hypothetical protein
MKYELSHLIDKWHLGATFQKINHIYTVITKCTVIHQCTVIHTLVNCCPEFQNLRLFKEKKMKANSPDRNFKSMEMFLIAF